MKNKKILARKRRIKKIRRKIIEHGDIRLSVYRSNAHMCAQVIDPVTAKVLAQASTHDKSMADVKVHGNIEAAKIVGKLVAERAIAAGISKVTFDRSGLQYHGRVKAVAEAAREAGLDL